MVVVIAAVAGAISPRNVSIYLRFVIIIAQKKLKVQIGM